jgi:hypothetical protein
MEIKKDPRENPGAFYFWNSRLMASTSRQKIGLGCNSMTQGRQSAQPSQKSSSIQTSFSV